MLQSKSYSLDKKIRTHRHRTVIVATILKHALMYFTNINIEEKKNISKRDLLIKQSKAEVIATTRLQHQSFNVLKRNIIHSNVIIM